MKKISLTAVVSSLLFITACTEDNSLQQQPTVDGNVTLTVEIPSELKSRGFSDGFSAKHLVYAVYDAASTHDLIMENQDNIDFAGDELSKTVSLNLANGKTYRIAFFAYNETGGVYTFDATNKVIKVDYAKMGTTYNSTDHDCFFNVEEIKVDGPINKSVTLNRPVAQINWGTNDLNNASVENRYESGATKLKTKVEFEGVYSMFDIFEGKVTGETANVTFNNASRPKAYDAASGEGERYPISGYDYLSMNYILVPGEHSLVNAKLTANGAKNSPVTVTNLPVQANYRTNIYGSLLTSSIDIEVKKEPRFAGTQKPFVFETIDGKEYLKAESTEDLATGLSSGTPTFIPAGTTVDMSEYGKDGKISINKPAEILLKGEIINLRADIEFKQGLTITGDETGNGVLSFDQSTEPKDIGGMIYPSIPPQMKISDGELLIKDVTINVEGGNTNYPLISGSTSSASVENVSIITDGIAINISSSGKVVISDCKFEGKGIRTVELSGEIEVKSSIISGFIPLFIDERASNVTVTDCSLIMDQVVEVGPNATVTDFNAPIYGYGNINYEFANCNLFVDENITASYPYLNSCATFKVGNVGDPDNNILAGGRVNFVNCRVNRDRVSRYIATPSAIEGFTFTALDSEETNIAIGGKNYNFTHNLSGEVVLTK